MSEIPYYFETPVPKYFRATGWFDNENTFKYVTWAFSKCQTQSHKTVIEGKEITLAPYEFISGRLTSSKECFLTENQFRNQQKSLLDAGLLKKTTNSLTNHYTCYIWVTERFSKINNQPNNQPGTNRPPTDHHKSEDKKDRYKKDHPSIPSFGSDRMIDDFSFEKEKIEIITGVFLSQKDLDSCIALKGDLEKVKYAIDFIQSSKKRKHAINDWPKALSNWKIENKTQNKMQQHIEYSEKICNEFLEFKNGHGWRCYMYTDRKKDQRGILFQAESSYQKAFFLALTDGEFQTKCEDFIKSKNMRKK